jgi:DNA-binding XRE family transcriptional regulator
MVRRINLALMGSPASGSIGSMHPWPAPLETPSNGVRAPRKTMITSEQVKAARKLLGWSQMTLSMEADVSIPTLVGFERGQKVTRGATVSRIQKTFESAGIIFPDGEPVRAPLPAA